MILMIFVRATYTFELGGVLNNTQNASKMHHKIVEDKSIYCKLSV